MDGSSGNLRESLITSPDEFAEMEYAWRPGTVIRRGDIATMILFWNAFE